jgi:hypothetical protein
MVLAADSTARDQEKGRGKGGGGGAQGAGPTRVPRPRTWAATVCERVGNSFVMHAVLKPCSARPMAARRPAPPAPTTTASKVWSTARVAGWGVRVDGGGAQEEGLG